jgi:hypothetical protein
MPCPLISDHASHRNSKLENTPFPPPQKKKQKQKPGGKKKPIS